LGIYIYIYFEELYTFKLIFKALNWKQINGLQDRGLFGGEIGS